MVTTLLAFNFLLMIGLPLLLGRWIARQHNAGWGLFGVGAAAFVLSQIGHLPFNWLILQKLQWVGPSNLLVYAIFLGLSAGSFEGAARYLVLRFWAKKARSWGTGLMVGIGHGGIEAILLGALGLLNFSILLGLREGHFQGILATVPESQLYLVDLQIDNLFGVSATTAVMGAVERIFALMLHLSATLLVMQVFLRQQLRWLLAAVLWHAAIDGVLVYVFLVHGGIIAETVLGGMSLVSLAIIFLLRQPEPAETELEPLPPLRAITRVEVSGESLERSKYTS